MNPVWGHLIGVIIVLLMTVFIGIWVWAWLPRHGKVFAELAKIPMEDPTFPSDAPSSTAFKDATR